MQVVGILQNPEYVTYAEPDPWPDVRAALQRLAVSPSPFRRIAEIGGIYARTVERGRQDSEREDQTDPAERGRELRARRR